MKNICITIFSRHGTGRWLHTALLVGYLLVISAPAVALQRALIVAVSSYPNLAPYRQLAGPKNDAREMVDFLVRFQRLERSDITLLADGVVGRDGEPTRAAIMRALAGLALQAQPGDIVWIYLAGHGSQQPQPRGRAEPEPDGLDEIFLPQDVGRWDGEIGAVKNAIIDDEIGQSLALIRRAGADVTIIFDTCHAGDSVRAGHRRGSEVLRSVPGAELGIPSRHLVAAASADSLQIATIPRQRAGGDGKSARSTSAATRHTSPREPPLVGRLLALYAGAAHESTPELNLPIDSPGAKKRGLFTFTLLSVWAKQPDFPPEALIREVKLRYRESNRTSPTPTFEKQ